MKVPDYFSKLSADYRRSPKVTEDDLKNNLIAGQHLLARCHLIRPNMVANVNDFVTLHNEGKFDTFTCVQV